MNAARRVQEMNADSGGGIPATYITAIPATDMFADLTYQREPDMARVRQIAAAWDVRLVGVLEVSDRGEDASPRYAVIDGHHRVRAAQLPDITPPLVATVHTGLTVQQEAELFDRLNRERRRLTTWDHWRARTAAGEPTVLAIKGAVAQVHLVIDDAPKPGHVRCTATLEKLYQLGGTRLITDALRLARDAWGDEVTSFDAPLVHGVGLVLHYLQAPRVPEPIDLERLTHALLGLQPRQIKTSALALRDRMNGSAGKLVAMVLIDFYNKERGHKILVSTRTFGPTARNARSTKGGDAS